MTGKKLILAALVLALAQTGFLSWSIFERARILRDGTEVLLRVQPVDPRDLLRGDYVFLSYDISRLPAKLFADLPSGQGDIREGPVTVRLRKGNDGHWQALTAWRGAASSAPGADEVDVKGRVFTGLGLTPDSTVSVSYGIERFYLPENEGLAIENDMRERPFSVRVAVGKDGTAQIKALMDGDKMLFEEPLY